MKIVIDTDNGKILLNGEQIYDFKPPLFDLAGFFEEYEGVKEYSGVVSDIQKWYYGYVSKTPWCATSISYFADLCGLGKIVGKYENVDLMKKHFINQGRLDCTVNYGGGAYTPKRNDIVFMSRVYDFGDCTHVMVVQSVNGNKIKCIGGNTSDAILSREYDYIKDRYIVAFGNTQV